VDVAEIQEAVTDELKKVQNMNFRQVFRDCTTAQKPVFIPVVRILNFKKIVSLMCLLFLKKISPKTFGPHCLYNRQDVFCFVSKFYYLQNLEQRNSYVKDTRNLQYTP
jgi:hypothetical protein